ncbi:microtubule-associated protein Jupiter isoform X3 [Stomoxys calcitrans]|uniref:microtubule-associated protein Jupiter isoform X3 n=1 Tax=Stomoxys calcitrans TaxID=35570 RepID=UPI0027E3A290|nr:microtubule-associated protein Jupiter isoform X3 [Stomoxys calcitrans]
MDTSKLIPNKWNTLYPYDEVLRPPGGGTSDIFGGDMPQTPRSIKNHMQSNIFSCDKKDGVKNNVRQGAHRFYFIGDQPRRGQKNVDSYQRLFGEPDRAATPAKNHMKSNIPFGSNNDNVISNGNGNGHHYNGKSGSASSASSSVSSSTENLKMNGYSKTVYHRKMSKIESDSNCSSTISSEYNSENTVTSSAGAGNIDNNLKEMLRQESCNVEDSGAGDVTIQTRNDSGGSPENPISMTTTFSSLPAEDHLSEYFDVGNAAAKAAASARNPLTGVGLNGDGVGGWKPIKPKTLRDGNPVTGEGYNKSNDFSTHTPSVNGANQVINKNRIPPGGFSSGLW